MARVPVALAVIALLLATATPALANQAEPYPFCQPDQSPRFASGFQALSEPLGGVMGEPLECEHGDPVTGDTHQKTSTGLAYYRKATNAPTFTNGIEHWALGADGLVYWSGEGADPPGVVVPWPTATPVPTAIPQAKAAPTITPVSFPEGWQPGPLGSGSPKLRGSIDVSAGATVPRYEPLTVYGWAANLADPVAPGVTAIHVYDGDVSKGQFLGAATLGERRSDVARALGDSRLESAGFRVDIPTGGLSLGSHSLSFLAKTRENGWWQRPVDIVVGPPPPRAKGQFILGTHMANPAATASKAKAAGFSHIQQARQSGALP